MICECQFEITPKNKKDETREFCSKSCCGVLNNRKRNINNKYTILKPKKHSRNSSQIEPMLAKRSSLVIIDVI